jgi:hypothetical protein
MRPAPQSVEPGCSASTSVEAPSLVIVHGFLERDKYAKKDAAGRISTPTGQQARLPVPASLTHNRLRTGVGSDSALVPKG